ncbi:MAG: hypothetical protein R3A80_06150 [Bdellovibrionota bacterium]
MFLDSGAGVLPTNPYNNLKTVGDCVSTTYVGWCYDATAGVVTPSYTTDPP